MTGKREILERIRRRSTPVENALIDELLAGRMTRRECLHRGAVLGMALPVLGAITGSTAVRAAEIPTTRHLGGAIRVGLPVHAGSIDPLTVADTGGVWLLSQTGGVRWGGVL